MINTGGTEEDEANGGARIEMGRSYIFRSAAPRFVTNQILKAK